MPEPAYEISDNAPCPYPECPGTKVTIKKADRNGNIISVDPQPCTVCKR